MVNYLPPEIIVDEILPKLPAKSLLRFKCVSKSFKTLISSPNFINHHLRRHSLSTVNNRHLIVNLGGLHIFDLDSPELPPTPLLLPNNFSPNISSGVVGPCNGLFLLTVTTENRSVFHFVVINPFTGFYRLINTRPGFLLNFGLGFDPHTGDYKFLEFSSAGLSIYSLINGSPRSIFNIDNLQNVDVTVVVILNRGQLAVVVNHCLFHWLVWCPVDREHRIVCLDISTEKWIVDVPLPRYESCGDDMLFENKEYDMINLAVFEGYLSVQTRNRGGDFDVWVMTDYGVVESWIKLFSVPDRWSVPLCYSTRTVSKVLVKTTHSRLKWYNVEDKRFENAEIHDTHGFDHALDACVFGGSLVVVPGGQQIRRVE